MNGFHLLKAAQRMALGNQLRDGSVVKGASDQQNNVVNHVAVTMEDNQYSLFIVTTIQPFF